MRAVVQRVLEASVTVDGERVAGSARGCWCCSGVGKGDAERTLTWMAEKLANLRIFEDDAGKMNRSLRTPPGGASW